MHCYYSTVILVLPLSSSDTCSANPAGIIALLLFNSDTCWQMCYVLSYYSPLKSVTNFLIPRVNLMTCRRDSPRLDVRGKSAPAVYNQTFFHYRGVTSSSMLDMQSGSKDCLGALRYSEGYNICQYPMNPECVLPLGSGPVHVLDSLP